MPHPENEHNHMSDAPHQMYGLVMGHSRRTARTGGVRAQNRPEPSG
jgi:hypothetical protein